MDIATTDSLKEELITRDPEFRELAREHHKYEERLSELSALILSERRRTVGGNHTEEEKVSHQGSDVLDDGAVPEDAEPQSLKLTDSFSELKELKGTWNQEYASPFTSGSRSRRN